jgi:hypothetical protein
VIRKANAADPRIRGISLSRNFGKEAALTGLDAARGMAVVPSTSTCRIRPVTQDGGGVA